MSDYQKYGIEVGQRYSRADGVNADVLVLDVMTYAHVNDVIVYDLTLHETRRIDAFKLARVRYTLQALPSDKSNYDISPARIREAAVKTFGEDLTISGPHWVDHERVRFGVVKGDASWGANFFYKTGIVN